MGPRAPTGLPTASAAWELYTEADGSVWWHAWWLGDGYYDQVTDLSKRGMGTYTVLR